MNDTLLYSLANNCPLPWPTAPKYLADQGALPSSASREKSQSPAKSDTVWLRRNYRDALYARSPFDGVNERISTLSKGLRRRQATVTEALEAAVYALEEFDRKYRPDVLKTVKSGGGHLPDDERVSLAQTLERECRVSEATNDSKEGTSSKARTARDIFTQLEIVEVKLQVALLLELLVRRQAGAEVSLDPDPLLRIHTDRLVIHQALSGLDLSFSTSKQQAGDSPIELDDVQLFWRAMEEVYATGIPSIFIDFIRGKLFTNGALSALSLTTLPSAIGSPTHHGTPDLKKLAQAVSAAAAENAANRIPESPTLAKFIANPAGVTGVASTFQPRPFARSRSSVSAAFLSTRQKEMGVRPLAPPPTSNPIINGTRPNKRKAPEPARVAPNQSAAASQVLVGTTPRRSVSRVLAAETPVKDDDVEMEIPETPAS